MKKLLFSIALAAVAATGNASVPLWLRDVSISPDGKQILFCYKGDIYKVPVSGGAAVRLTTQSSYESNPVWSPDGKQIAFASNRFDNNFDIFVMSAAGGTAKRLTVNTANETPSAFSPDGKHVYFSASIQDPAQSALFPKGSMTELYKVPVTGGRTLQVLGTPAQEICFDAKGENIYYQDNKGVENEWRKHHTSSVTRDLWKYSTKTGKHTNLTAHAGEDRSPVLSADGGTMYFLSERNGGSFNVYSMSLGNTSEVKAITNFKNHPVRFLSRGGNTLCFTYDGEIYTQPLGGKPAKVNVEIVRDDTEIIDELAVSRGASSAVVSPDGKQVAFVYRGEVFVTSVEYGTTKQITHTAAAESGVTFGADSRTLVYSSDRDGKRQLYMAKIVRKEDPNFPNATLINEEVLLPSADVERSHPDFSPDGKELAFIEGRKKLMVMNMATKKVRQITDGKNIHTLSGGFGYEWSPDGKWFTLTFIGNRHDPYSDVGLVSADGNGKIVNLTNSGYFSSSPRFVMNGNAILFATDRYGMRAHASWGSQEDAMLVFLNQDSYDKYMLSKEDYELRKELEKEQKKNAEKGDAKKDNKGNNGAKADDKKAEKKDIVVELDGITDRIVRLTPQSGNLGDAILTPDGETLYYTAAHQTGNALWKMDLRKHETKLVQDMPGNASMSLSKDGKSIFLLGGTMRKMDVASGKMTPITFSAKMKLDHAAEREAMFNTVVKEEGKRFYNTNMHGVDWVALTKNYRKFLPHINNNFDFSEMLSELLGELNVSHTGSGFRPGAADNATARLGLLFDMTYTGKGMKIDEVLDKGSFGNSFSKVKAGMIVEKIDGVEITADTDISALLAGKAKKKTLVSVYDAKSNSRFDEVVLPISAGAENTLLYKRWVKQRAEDVHRWSNGRLGYVHIESMNDDSFRNIYSDILGKYNHCEGIVIDTRFNGGGRLHEDIEVLFSGEKYFTQVVRGDEACDMPSRRWNKPSIMITCEANYSNAHGTPWVYKHKNLGKIVGMPVPGTMTSVNWVTLQDPSLYFGIPVVGYRLPDGSYLENTQLEPDVKVANAPETIVTGEDTQLRTAVEELLKSL